MDQVEVSVITLDNGKNYEIVDKIKDNDQTYLFLINENDENDKCIRKQVIENDKEILYCLNEDEFKNVLEKFMKKYKGEK